MDEATQLSLFTPAGFYKEGCVWEQWNFQLDYMKGFKAQCIWRGGRVVTVIMFRKHEIYVIKTRVKYGDEFTAVVEKHGREWLGKARKLAK